MAKVMEVIGLGVLAYFGIKAYNSYQDGHSVADAVGLSSASSVQQKAKIYDQAPPDQKRFMELVALRRDKHNAAPNEMAAGAERPARAADICGEIKSPKVTNWVGYIDTLSSNGDGLGVLTVTIGDKVAVATWNNSLSDGSQGTLISPNSDVFASASKLKKGMPVRFSGTLFPNRTDCFQEKSMTLRGSMTSPEFVFRFASVEPA